jgi:membrane-associated protease RseP (regulator of RpoE activity)
MIKLFKDILTCANNVDYDIGRVICLVSYLVYFGLSIIDTSLGHSWSAMDFSGGVGTMAVGFGVNFKLKQDTEPK